MESSIDGLTLRNKPLSKVARINQLESVVEELYIAIGFMSEIVLYSDDSDTKPVLMDSLSRLDKVFEDKYKITKGDK